MIRVVKGNKELQVEDNFEDKYLSDGWSVIDDKGKVLKAPVNAKVDAKEFAVLQKKYDDLKEKYEESEKENEALAAKVQELEKPKK